MMIIKSAPPTIPQKYQAFPLFFLVNCVLDSKPAPCRPPNSFIFTPPVAALAASFLDDGGVAAAGGGGGAAVAPAGGDVGAGAAAAGAPGVSSFNSILPSRNVWPGFKIPSVIFSPLMNEPLVEPRSFTTISLPRSKISQ